MRRFAPALLLCMAFAGIWVGLATRPAAAHAALVESEPSNGAVLGEAPQEIRLSFTEPPDLSLTIVEIVDSGGASVPTGPVEKVPGSDREVRIPIQNVPDGVYTVTWRTVSTADGHITSDAFSFGVGVDPEDVAPVPPGSATETPPPNAISVAARWGLYAGLAVLFGAALAGLLALGIDAVARPWLLGTAWLVSFVGVIVMTLEERSAVGVPLGTLLSSDAGGKFVRLGVAVGVTGIAVLAVALRASTVTMLALAATTGAAIVARAMGGHAGGSASDVVVHSLHLAGIGTWIGGLVWLVAGVRGGLAPAAIRRFSNVAAGGLIVVATSGVLRASGELGGPGWFLDPFRNGYRTALVGKLALVVPLVALGAVNRFRNVPRFESLGARPLLRTVGAELALAACVLAVAGILTGIPPKGSEEPRHADAQRPLVATGSDFATTTAVRLAIAPGAVGPNEFVVDVADYDTGEPVDARRVSLEFHYPPRPEVGSTLELELDEDGTWRAEGTSLSLEGTWHVGVLVEGPSGSVEVPLLVTPRTPGQRIEVTRASGQPDLFTIHLQDGLRIQSYIDPGLPDRTNQVHVTAFDADGNELELERTALEIAPPAGLPFQPELLLLAPGHVVANVDMTAGTWSFHITAETHHGDVLSASFEQDV
ncbi:MAG: copper resistance CopC/CopD family protein [Actinomycetota bacterium]